MDYEKKYKDELDKQSDTPQGKTYIFEGKSVLEAINKISEEKPAWSEEDEAHINGIIDYLLDYKLSVNEEDMNVANGVQEEIDWLKSLKERYIWKPIDEQMRALENFIGTIPSYERMFQILKSFYNELKKLKGD